MGAEFPAKGSPMLDVVVVGRREEAEGIASLELRPMPGEWLPSFTAGAHIEVHVPTDQGVLHRHYSLANDPSERHRYVIAVGRDPASRGASRWIHDHLREGQLLRIGEPRNNFPLVEDAARSVLIAGGIGITPLLAMARRLSTLNRKWSLYYCARTPARAAFLQDLLNLGGEVVPVFDAMAGVAKLDLHALVASTATDTHLYCCGPGSLLEAFLDAAGTRDKQTVHVEWFSAPPESSPGMGSDSAFTVRLARSNLTLQVGADQSILEVVRAAGVDVAHSCLEGICGSCETKVVSGECDHRDLILADPTCHKSMMICVSRAKGDEITLDL